LLFSPCHALYPFLWQIAKKDEKYIDISAGHRTTCAINADHFIECWGRRSPMTPDEGSIATFEQLTLGSDHLCAADSVREVRCWFSGPDMGSHLVPLGMKLY
jgi:hypothetical protein